MIIDNHVHVGWFSDRYHSPREVWHSALAAGVDGVAVSSTSTCAELYKVVVREMRELVRLGGSRIHPNLWLTPKMLKCRYALPYMLHSKVAWQGVKLHWEAHPEWGGNKKLLRKALDVARLLGVPVLLHTGEKQVCRAGRFAEMIGENCDLTFVLAHGRPIDEAMDVLRQFGNVYVDTAFMPIADVTKLVDEKMAGRVLFGSDAPINEVFFPDISTESYVKHQITQLRSACSGDADEILGRTVYGE